MIESRFPLEEVFADLFFCLERRGGASFEATSGRMLRRMERYLYPHGGMPAPTATGLPSRPRRRQVPSKRRTAGCRLCGPPPDRLRPPAASAREGFPPDGSRSRRRSSRRPGPRMSGTMRRPQCNVRPRDSGGIRRASGPASRTAPCCAGPESPCPTGLPLRRRSPA